VSARPPGDTEAVGREPIDVVRELNRWWARRDFETARELLLASEGWDDAAERFRQAGLEVDPIDPEVEVVVDAFPQGGVWIGQRGRDGWIQFWQAWVRPWTDFGLEASDYEQIGNHVVAEVRMSARARDTGEVVEIAAVQLFKVRDGLITLYAVYPNRDDALAAIRAE
jgi:hypothetical protein